MPNPKKTRKVQFFPKVNCFVHSEIARAGHPQAGGDGGSAPEGFGGLDQEACAKEMDISGRRFSLFWIKPGARWPKRYAKGCPCAFWGEIT